MAAHPNLSLLEEDAQAAALLAGFSEKVDALKNTVIGRVADPLCRRRIPGQVKDSRCPNSPTEKHGSDVATLVAHAMRTMLPAAEIAVQNAGGVRIRLPAGDLSIGDAYLLLPWGNTLVEMQVTGAEIHAALEDALDYAMNPDGSTGAFPYAAGLRWHIDATRPKGARFSAIEFKPAGESGWVPLESGRTYRLVTNSYIAGGKDGYATLGAVSRAGRAVDTYLVDAQVFVDYVRRVQVVSRIPAEDYSTRSFTR